MTFDPYDQTSTAQRPESSPKPALRLRPTSLVYHDLAGSNYRLVPSAMYLSIINVIFI